MLLGDPDVEEPVPVLFGETVEARALEHRGGDCDDLRVGIRQPLQGFPEHLRVGRGPGVGRDRLSGRDALGFQKAKLERVPTQ